jgi:hypothetical protein
MTSRTHVTRLRRERRRGGRAGVASSRTGDPAPANAGKRDLTPAPRQVGVAVLASPPRNQAASRIWQRGTLTQASPHSRAAHRLLVPPSSQTSRVPVGRRRRRLRRPQAADAQLVAKAQSVVAVSHDLRCNRRVWLASGEMAAPRCLAVLERGGGGGGGGRLREKWLHRPRTGRAAKDAEREEGEGRVAGAAEPLRLPRIEKQVGGSRGLT